MENIYLSYTEFNNILDYSSKYNLYKKTLLSTNTRSMHIEYTYELIIKDNKDNYYKSVHIFDYPIKDYDMWDDYIINYDNEYGDDNMYKIKFEPVKKIEKIKEDFI